MTKKTFINSKDLKKRLKKLKIIGKKIKKYLTIKKIGLRYNQIQFVGGKKMYKSISEFDFVDAFAKLDRDENFSYEGKKALFSYLEQLEEDTGKKIELDIIALCCEYSEYKNLEELQKDYDIESMEELEEKTTVIMINDESFIIQEF